MTFKKHETEYGHTQHSMRIQIHKRNKLITKSMKNPANSQTKTEEPKQHK